MVFYGQRDTPSPHRITNLSLYRTNFFQKLPFFFFFSEKTVFTENNENGVHFAIEKLRRALRVGGYKGFICDEGYESFSHICLAGIEKKIKRVSRIVISDIFTNVI